LQCQSHFEISNFFISSCYNYFSKTYSGVPLEEELAVMGRLRDFLLQHGVLLNFCFDNWRMVTLVLTANEEIDDLRAAPHRGRSAGGTKLRRNDRQAYICTAFNNLDTPPTMANASAGLRHEGNLTTGAITSSKEFVVEFPQDFRPTMLLDVLLDLPAASVLKRGV
jgi:hypothetical protein